MTTDIQLQVGKWYRRRNGAIVGPARQNHGSDASGFPFIVGDDSYQRDGRILDITVVEVDPTPATDSTPEIRNFAPYLRSAPGQTHTLSGQMLYDLTFDKDLVEEVPAPGAREPAPKDEWQPISTAPKDGSWFLIAHFSPNIPHGCAYEVGRHNTIRPGGYEWDGFSNFHRATHWARTPEPPHTADTNRDKE